MDPAEPAAVWQDTNHRWRIEVYRVPDTRFAVYATNGPTESAPLWLLGMPALARWLRGQCCGLFLTQAIQMFVGPNQQLPVVYSG